MIRYIAFILLAINTLAYGENFHVDVKYINTGNDFTKLCANRCPALNYGLISASDKWVEQVINKSIVSIFGTAGRENSPQDLAYQRFAKIAQPTDKQLTDFLRTSELNLIDEHKRLIDEHGYQSTPLIDISSRPNYLGHRGDLELFSVSEFYLFGNQLGTGSVYYFVFDIKQQKQLTIDDVLLPNQKAKLANKVKEKFHTALKKGNVNVAQHEKSWYFYLTKNFTFTKDGLKVLYQPEEIAPYNMGMPEFVIRYSELKGIVRPEYLK